MQLQIVLFLCLFGLTFAQLPKFNNHCQACQSLTEKIELKIEDQIKYLDQHVDEIMNAVLDVCNHTIFNQDYTDKCNGFVKKIPEIIEYWNNFNITFNHEVFCQFLGFCDVDNLNLQLFQIGSKSENHKDKCEVCEYVVDKIQQTMEDHADDINDHYLEVHFAIMAVCNSEILNYFLGQNFTDRCNTFLEGLPELILYWLDDYHDFSSEAVCANLGYCTNSTLI